MRRWFAALLLVLLAASSGCSDDDDAAPVRSASSGSGGAYSQEVRGNFLTSCLENAKNTAGAAASEQQLTRTCECILGKVEQEYSEAEFADFEKRLLAGGASDAESGRLVNWSTECARQSAG